MFGEGRSQGRGTLVAQPEVQVQAWQDRKVLSREAQRQCSASRPCEGIVQTDQAPAATMQVVWRQSGCWQG
jgi:hypothetical protein